MRITNKLNLPKPLVEAIVNSGYSAGDNDFTATSLIEPARIGALKVKHAEEITEDASDLIYSLQGQSIHTILERAAKALEEEGYVAERRFSFVLGGLQIGAQVDVYHPPTGLLQDYKITSVYSVRDGIKEEYAQQMNIQAECLRQNGHKVNQMQIVAILRDWSKGERDRDWQEARAKGFDKGRYPESQVVILEVPIINSKEVMTFIKERVKLHIEARKDTLPQCTPEERWMRGEKWAIVEKGKKRAKKLYDSKSAAEEALLKGEVVEHRPGRNIRCEQYCPVSKFCSQWKKLKENG